MFHLFKTHSVIHNRKFQDFFYIRCKDEYLLTFNLKICIFSFTGTALFFKSKVTYVRSEDNEYDIQFEDGTVYTLKAKEVRKTVKVAASKTERRRSRSRGRSPARKTAESPEGKNFEKS